MTDANGNIVATDARSKDLFRPNDFGVVVGLDPWWNINERFQFTAILRGDYQFSDPEDRDAILFSGSRPRTSLVTWGIDLGLKVKIGGRGGYIGPVGSRGIIQVLIAAIFCITISRCSAPAIDPRSFSAAHFDLADGTAAEWASLRGPTATVLITLDPECPFCQGYAPVINSLEERYRNDGIRFVGLYPTSFIHPDSAARFARLSGFDFPQVMDADCSLSNALHARVTPECFVLDAEDELIYHGAIDDWAVRAGRHKVRATRHYLVEALNALLAGGSPAEVEVAAKGCIVDCDEVNQ